MRTITREYGQKTYTANQQETIPLPRDYAQNDIMVELAANITIASGSSSGVLKDYAPAGLIQSINIRANGSDVIKSLSFQDIVIQTALRYGVVNKNTLMPDGGILGATDYYVYGRIDFSMFRTIKPYDTIFNSKRLTSFDAIIQWGNAASMYATAGDRTVTINSATVTLYGKEAIGIAADQVFPVFKESTILSTISATSSEHKIALNYASDLSYRQLVLLGFDDGVLSNSVINNVKLQSGGVVFVNINSRRLQARNQTLLGIAIPAGQYVLDFAEDGRINDSLDTAGLSSLDLILDVTAASTQNTVKVLTNEIIVPTVVKS